MGKVLVVVGLSDGIKRDMIARMAENRGHGVLFVGSHKELKELPELKPAMLLPIVMREAMEFPLKPVIPEANLSETVVIQRKARRKAPPWMRR